MEGLTEDQEMELLKWIEKFELSRPSKKLSRDFSDAGTSYYPFTVFFIVIK